VKTSRGSTSRSRESRSRSAQARAVSRIIPVFVVGRLPRVTTRASTKLTSVVVAVARTDIGLPPVVISVVVVGGAPAAAATVEVEAVILAGVGVARVEIRHGRLRKRAAAEAASGPVDLDVSC
jgi:hypothetical protein